jgi:hypothetical protein
MVCFAVLGTIEARTVLGLPCTCQVLSLGKPLPSVRKNLPWQAMSGFRRQHHNQIATLHFGFLFHHGFILQRFKHSIQDLHP